MDAAAVLPRALTMLLAVVLVLDACHAHCGPNNAWANDGACDVPMYCEEGNDNADCATATDCPDELPHLERHTGQAGTGDVCRVFAGDTSNHGCPNGCLKLGVAPWCVFDDTTTECRVCEPVAATGHPCWWDAADTSCAQCGDGCCQDSWTGASVQQRQQCAPCASGGEADSAGAPSSAGNYGSQYRGGATQCGTDNGWANDGACDVPQHCADGTDDVDCGTGNAAGNTCRYAYDNEWCKHPQ